MIGAKSLPVSTASRPREPVGWSHQARLKAARDAATEKRDRQRTRQNSLSPLPQQSETGRRAAKHPKQVHPKDSLRARQSAGCKPRPEPTQQKRGAGGASREFIPWCEARKRR